MADTLILTDFQAENKEPLLACVRDTLVLMGGWAFDVVPKYISPPAWGGRFYAFNLTKKTFYQNRQNHSLSDTMDSDEVVINDLSDISHLLEFIYENQDSLNGPIATNPWADILKKWKTDAAAEIASEIDASFIKQMMESVNASKMVVPTEPKKEYYHYLPKTQPSFTVDYKHTFVTVPAHKIHLSEGLKAELKEISKKTIVPKINYHTDHADMMSLAEAHWSGE